MNAIGTGPTPLAQQRGESRSMVPPGVSRSVSEIPSRMLSVASVAMIEGILTPRTRPALTSPRARPQREDRRDADQDLGGGGLGTDQEGGDDHAEGDHRPHRQVEIADEERVGLAHGHHGQRHGEEQDGGDVRSVDEPGEPELVYQTTATISRIWSTTGIQSRNLTILRHLFLSRALRRTLRTASLVASSRPLTACPARTGPWAWPRRRAIGRPGQPGSADDGLDDAAARRVRRRGSPR